MPLKLPLFTPGSWELSFRAQKQWPQLNCLFLPGWGRNFTRLWRRQWHPTPVLLPGKSHGRRSLGGCSPRGLEESDMTEWLHFHFSLLCIREGNGNPLQWSCLENPRDGVAQSRTRLEWLSSSSSMGILPGLESLFSQYTSPPPPMWSRENLTRRTYEVESP